MQIIKVVKTVISFFLFCSIRVVVEDKESSGGAFSMKVSPTATIERLQQEVTCREIPVPSQWIFLTLSCNINSSSYFSSNKYTPRYGSIHHAEFNNLNTCSLLRVLYKLVKIWEPKLANRPISVHQNSGNNYRDCRVYYQEPGAKVYCVWLNFNIS